MARVPFLATTALETFWDTGRPLVFLGEWCRLHKRRHVWSNLEHTLAPALWTTFAAVDKAIASCDAVYEQFLPVVAETLNRYHRLSFSLPAYRILLGDWLLHFVHVVHDHRMALAKAFDAFGEMDTLLLDPAQRYVVADFPDFLNQVINDPYNLLLFSDILRAEQQKQFPSARCDALAAQGATYTLPVPGLSEHVLGHLLKVAELFPSRRPLVLTDLFLGGQSVQKIAALLLAAKGRWRYCLFKRPFAAAYRIDQGFRRTPLPGPRTGLAGVLAKLIPAHLPVGLLEVFGALRRHALAQCPKKPAGFVTAVGCYNNIAFKIIAAEHAGRVPLVEVQHGGNYGWDKGMVLEQHERAIAAAYFSWGWGERTLPHPRLLAKAGRNRGSSTALLVCNDRPRYLVRLQTLPLPSSMIPEYLETRETFLRELRSPVMVRLYPGDYGWEQRDRLLEKMPNLRFADNIPFRKAMDQHKLCIFDHMGTTFLEAMAADKPSVIFHVPGMYTPRPDVLAYSSLLQKAGILFTDATAAANHVDNIHNDIFAWWGSPEVQHARTEFVNRFAKTQGDWAQAWVRHIEDAWRSLHGILL